MNEKLRKGDEEEGRLKLEDQKEVNDENDEHRKYEMGWQIKQKFKCQRHIERNTHRAAATARAESPAALVAAASIVGHSNKRSMIFYKQQKKRKRMRLHAYISEPFMWQMKCSGVLHNPNSENKNEAS